LGEADWAAEDVTESVLEVNSIGLIKLALSFSLTARSTVHVTRRKRSDVEGSRKRLRGETP
jgi:hypothetical protein